jgi:LruC domain-containing protein
MKTIVYFKLMILTGFVSLVVSTTSCRKKDTQEPVLPAGTNISNMHVQRSFTFQTSNPVGVTITTLDNADQPVPNIRVNVYTDYPENGGTAILSGVTDAAGVYHMEYKFAAFLDSLVVGTTAIGFANFLKIPVKSGSLTCILGGKHQPAHLKSSDDFTFKSTTSNYYPMGTYNSNGVPSYLMPVNDIIDAAMLSDITATLPEYISLVNSHPQYFAPTNEPNLVLKDPSDVWVTFVHEGAGYRNVLGYYKYNTNNPPTSPAGIDSIHIIFPNVSFSGSGGGLTSGNKVHLGVFAPGTEIAWVLIADGFRNNTITNGNWVLYSDKMLNPEPNTALRQHTTLLNDIGRGKFLLSFEDQRRDGSCDNDFNDAVFYVTANPIQAVNTANIPLPNYTQTDTDGDGISNAFDDYPVDATKAFNNFYPSQSPFGTLAFEDLWPAKGDYDCNDMVIDYHFNQITNGQNKVVQITMELVLKAMGASYNSGFGIQLPVSPALISSVTGSELHENYINLNTNGTEAGQTKATIIVFDNGYKILTFPGGNYPGINTAPGAPYVQPDTLLITVNLTTPTALSVIGTPPYNPFLIVNKQRGKEIHMINKPPTDLADLSLLGQSADDSDPATGRYYVTASNLPWVLDIPIPFDYPAEKAEVTQAFIKFIPWAESSGQTYFDWFKQKSGYRNTQNIYSH